MTRIRVLLVDDSRDFLAGIRAWFDGDPLVEIVGTAGAGGDAIEQVGRLRPDLVLLDLAAAADGCTEAVRCIKVGPEPPLVVLTSFHSSEAARRAAAAAGADRFLARSEVVKELAALARETRDRRGAMGPDAGSGAVDERRGIRE